VKNRKKTTNWIRFALKCGLLATDASVWSAVNHFLSERTNDVQDVFRRTDNLASDVRTHRRWSHASTLLTGIGVGVGLGMLLAPVSGQRARGAIRDKAADLKNKVGDVTDWAGRFGSQSGRTTGTYAH
jgi:hypothetical protein